MRIEDFKLFVMVDDSDTELFLTKALFNHSYPSLPFHGEKNPAQVLSVIERHAPAGLDPSRICVLLDIRMPHTNGFELIFRLRNELRTHNCCILMLSASRLADDREHSAAIGADGFLTKPFTVDKLEAALAAHRPSATPD